MIDKSDKSDSESSTSGASGMKVNVVYRGTLYRVRGVKVLVSVVTAVILLLVAIVGLGVWMLVSSYVEEKAVSFPADTNTTRTTPKPAAGRQESSTPFTIDFHAPSATLNEASLPTKVSNTRVIENTYTNESLANTDLPVSEESPASQNLPADAGDVSEAVGHFQGVTPRRNKTASFLLPPRPKPVFGGFNGVPNLPRQSSSPIEVVSPPADTAASPIEDSFVEYSENRPVTALPLPRDNHDYGGAPVAYEVNTNPWVEQRESESAPRYPLQGGLPDNIPRDIDPMLLEMGLPFPYPPSLATRAPRPPATSPYSRRPILPRHQVPAATRRGQVPERRDSYHSSESPRPQGGQQHREQHQGGHHTSEQHHRKQHQGGHHTSEQHHREQQHGGHHTIEQHHREQHSGYESFYTPTLEVLRVPEVPPVSRGTQKETFIRPGGLNYPDMQHFMPSEGSPMPAGLTLPPGVTLPPGISMPADISSAAELANLREAAEEHLKHRPKGPGSYLEDMLYYYNKHERGRPLTSAAPPSTSDDTRYSQRTGLTVDRTAQGYTGPPVVGYGDRPFKNNRRTLDPTFQYFWDTYGYDGSAPAEHDDRGPVPEEATHVPERGAPPPYSGGYRPPTPGYRPHTYKTRLGPRPEAAGPRHPTSRLEPNMRGGQPHPVRPDAERPPVMQPPNRQLWVDPGPRPSAAPSPRPGPSPPPNHRPFLGPLYDMYEYSKRLASTLLSFPPGAQSGYNSSREEYMMKEVQLLEDYNRVFQNPNTTSADVLPDMYDDRPNRNERLMLLDSSKLRSLNPFEMSLITWTFLDFWEFLIEQVGTLSPEDLALLEQRLVRLRLKKDRVMTKNLMTATVNHQVAQETNRGHSDAARAIALAEDLLKSMPEVEEEEEDASAAASKIVEGEVTGRMWNPLEVFNSNQKVKFMEFAIKVLFKFGRVYLQKAYALDCMMLLFCKDLNADSKKAGMDGTAAKIKR